METRATPRVVRRIRVLIYKCLEQFLAHSAKAYTVVVIIVEPALSSLVLWGLWQSPPGSTWILTLQGWTCGESRERSMDGWLLGGCLSGRIWHRANFTLQQSGEASFIQHWLSWAHCTQHVLPVSSETPAEIHGEPGSSVPSSISGAPHLL